MHFSYVFLPIPTSASNQVTAELLLVIYFFNHVIFLQKTRTIVVSKKKKRKAHDGYMRFHTAVKCFQPVLARVLKIIHAFNGVSIIQDRKQSQKGTGTLDNTNLKYSP